MFSEKAKELIMYENMQTHSFRGGETFSKQFLFVCKLCMCFSLFVRYCINDPMFLFL